MTSTGLTGLPHYPTRFFQICDFLKGAEVHRLSIEKVPFATKGNQWVGYEDKESVKNKVGFSEATPRNKEGEVVLIPSSRSWSLAQGLIGCVGTPGKDPRAQFPNTSPHLLHQVGFLKEHKLAGAMVWALDLDDFRSTCQPSESFPLINAIKHALA